MNPAFASPDRALVFEVIGPIAKFVEAANAIGFEWLTEDYTDAQPERVVDIDEDEADDDEDAATSRLYLTMPSLEGMRRLLGMWTRFQAKRSPADHEKEWWKVFGYLNAIRPWDATDRVDPTTQSFIDRRLTANPQAPVRLEVDLWFRGAQSLRQTARASLNSVLGAVGGHEVDFVSIEEIRYQVALIEVPSEQARNVGERAGPLANADAVMTIRPQSMFAAAPGDDAGDKLVEGQQPAANLRPAVAAILDGYPIENHELLAGRLEVEEVDITGVMVPVDRRYHGTAISSLILHGDLTEEQDALTRKLKVVPVLAAPQGLADERTHTDYLPLGLIYRAVRALKEGLDGRPAVGPDVVLINHSLCDAEGPFVRRPSHWARLLDWLSHKYGVLFVVSAGNISERFASGYLSDQAFVAAAPLERQVALLRAIEASKGLRGLLSPAESMNALTVGALHLDGSDDPPAGIVDPLPAVGVPNIGSAVGPGINRALKPDLVEAGGRQVARGEDVGPIHMVSAYQHPEIGSSAAAPDRLTGSLSNTRRSTGTSNAAALVTRSGIRALDALEEVLSEENIALAQFPRAALATKVLLVHSAGWGDAGTLLNETYPPAGTRQWRRRRSSITKFLGFGRPDIDRVIAGDTNRITLLADDVIGHEQLHEYRIPIPLSMIRSRELRRIVLTMAWSPPIHPTSLAYRGTALEIVDEDGARKFWRGVKSVLQPHPDDTRRGTLQHLVLEGENSTTFTDADGLFIGVQGRAQHSMFERVAVPYALAITLEVAATVQEDIYNSVRTAIRPRARLVTRGGI